MITTETNMSCNVSAYRYVWAEWKPSFLALFALVSMIAYSATCLVAQEDTVKPEPPARRIEKRVEVRMELDDDGTLSIQGESDGNAIGSKSLDLSSILALVAELQQERANDGAGKEGTADDKAGNEAGEGDANPQEIVRLRNMPRTLQIQIKGDVDLDDWTVSPAVLHSLLENHDMPEVVLRKIKKLVLHDDRQPPVKSGQSENDGPDVRARVIVVDTAEANVEENQQSPHKNNLDAHEFRLGVALTAPSPPLRAQLNLDAGQGMLVTKVFQGTPAEAIGLKQYDVLTAIGNDELRSSDQPRLVSALQDAGEKEEAIPLKWITGGKRKQVAFVPQALGSQQHDDLAKNSPRKGQGSKEHGWNGKTWNGKTWDGKTWDGKTWTGKVAWRDGAKDGSGKGVWFLDPEALENENADVMSIRKAVMESVANATADVDVVVLATDDETDPPQSERQERSRRAEFVDRVRREAERELGRAQRQMEKTAEEAQSTARSLRDQLERQLERWRNASRLQSRELVEAQRDIETLNQQMEELRTEIDALKREAKDELND